MGIRLLFVHKPKNRGNRTHLGAHFPAGLHPVFYWNKTMKKALEEVLPGLSQWGLPLMFLCDQAYKPGSVVDSHLSWPDVAVRLTPPPRNAQGYAECSSTVLLRIGFTGPRGLPRAGELLPRLSTLTG